MSGDLSFQLSIWGFALHGDATEPAALTAESRQQHPAGRQLHDSTVAQLDCQQLQHDDEHGQPRTCRPPLWTALPAVVDAVARGLLPYSPCTHERPA